MNAGKTPLVQKLILGVLTLILVCLVVLIGQNRARRTPPISHAAPPSELTLEPVELTQREPPAEPVRSAPPRVAPQSQTLREQPEAQQEPAPAVQPAPVPASQPYVTLVSPARPKALDIVVHPQTGVLQTELCGRVRLEGQPPPEVPIRLYASCDRLNDGRPVTTRHYVVGEEGGLANVLVYIKAGLPSHYVPPPIHAPTATVSRCFYEPYVLGMQAGQKLRLVNADRVLHNVNGTTKNNKSFNFALSRKGHVVERVLDTPEIFVRVKCDVHPWEFGYVGVVEHPFFAVTDTNGVFCLPAGLPEGRYVLAAAHVKAGETLREIVVQQDDLGPIDIAFTVPRR